MYKYCCAYARNHRLLHDIERATIDECVDVIEYHARRVYHDRVMIEQYTDEIHVYVRRRNNNRRDFVASYQAE
jgi:hypothetical protein